MRRGRRESDVDVDVAGRHVDGLHETQADDGRFVLQRVDELAAELEVA